MKFQDLKLERERERVPLARLVNGSSTERGVRFALFGFEKMKWKNTEAKF